jgi:HK97 family phage major capsid protein
MEQHAFEALLEERAGLHTRMTEINDAAEGEGRDLTTEEAEEYDRVEGEFDSLSVRIKRAEKLERNTPTLTPGHPAPASEEEERAAATRDSDEYRDALSAYLRKQELDADQRSVLKIGSDEEGGFAVPEEWGTLHESLREFGTIRGLAEVITTETGASFHIPYVKVDAEDPKSVKENETTPDDADEFGERLVGAFKYARMTLASEEMVQDALFDVAGFVGGRLGFQLGRVTNKGYATGTGSEQPEGLISKSTVGLSGVSKTAGPTGDNLIDLSHSIIRPYRANASWLMADQTLAVIRKLKDKNEQYLWQPSIQLGEPDRILGYPVYSDPDIDTVGSKKSIVGFGDVKRAYMIRDALGVTIRVLTERYADKGQVAWRGVLRTDGRIIDQNAFKVAQCAE